MLKVSCVTRRMGPLPPVRERLSRDYNEIGELDRRVVRPVPHT